MWLWLAVLGPAGLVLLLRWAGRARREQLARFAAADLLGGLLASHSPRRRLVKGGLLVLAVAGIALALARPQWGEQTEVTQALGEDVIFLLDCSKSMLAEDVRPSRLG